MIAVDTSTWIGFLEGDGRGDAELLDRALQDRQVLMVLVVLTEVLSDPKLPTEVSRTLSDQSCRSLRSSLATGNGQVSYERRCWRSTVRRVLAMH